MADNPGPAHSSESEVLAGLPARAQKTQGVSVQVLAGLPSRDPTALTGALLGEDPDHFPRLRAEVTTLLGNRVGRYAGRADDETSYAKWRGLVLSVIEMRMNLRHRSRVA